jgi:predicted TIM-barrel fold metal-dependent hydrolase
MTVNSSAPVLPTGACDCHTHVIGPRQQYPMVQDRHYTPGPASVEDLQAHLARHGLERVVIIQPSFYGTDNSCTLDALDALGGRVGRAVAVVADDVDDAALHGMHSRGVRGLRLNVESGGIRDASLVGQTLQRWSRKVAHLGWHLQVFASFDTICGAAEEFARLEVPVVLDHFALVPVAMDVADPRAKPLLDLLRGGNAWLKLSAAYRLDGGGETLQDRVDAWAAAFIAAAPNRMLWGSDWPHTNREPGKKALEESAYRVLGDDVLDGGIRRWLPTPGLRQQVLVDNPARIYRFD